MAHLSTIVKGDTLQRLGSLGLMGGAVLLGLSGLTMPHAAASTSDLREMLTPLGEQAFLTQLSALLMMVGFGAVLIGAAGVYRSLPAGSGTAWARLGFNFALAGTVLWTVSLALDIAVARAVANWLAAPAGSQAAAWSVVAALSAIGQGMVPSTWIVYWAAYVFLGTAMIRSTIYPRWLGWAGLGLAVPMVILGIIQIFTTRSTTLTLIFAVLMLLTALWDLAAGLWIARRAWAPPA